MKRFYPVVKHGARFALIGGAFFVFCSGSHFFGQESDTLAVMVLAVSLGLTGFIIFTVRWPKLTAGRTAEKLQAEARASLLAAGDQGDASQAG